MSARPPEGMGFSTWEAVRALRDDLRLRVLERAAIKHFGAGLPWPEADAQAMAEERPQRALFGGGAS